MLSGPFASIASPVGWFRLCRRSDTLWRATPTTLAIMPIFLGMRPARGLAVHPQKTKVVVYGTASAFPVWRALQDIPGADGFAIVRHGTY